MTWFEQRFRDNAGSNKLQNATKASEQGTYFPLNAAQIYLSRVIGDRLSFRTKTAIG